MKDKAPIPTSRPLRALIIEDSEDDMLLMVHELQHGGFDLTYQRVDSAEAMKAALAEQSWDIIIADYRIPHFSPPAALALLQESGLDLPFIIVSDTIAEDVAVAALKAGTHDYLTKDKLARLVPTIERELREAEMRRERQRAEQVLHERENRFRALIEHASEVISLIDATGLITYVSPAITKILGYTPAEYVGLNAFDLLHPDDFQENARLFEQILQRPNAIRSSEFRFRHKDGSWHWIKAVGTNLLAEPNIEAIVVNFHDITERKQAEAELAQRAAHLGLINDIGSKIAAMLDLDDVLRSAARLVQETFGYHHVALFLLDREWARLRAVAGSYETYFPPGHGQKLSQGIIGWVGTHGEKVVANDVSAEPRYISLIADRTVTRAELCLPIKVAEQTVGVLDIQSPHLDTFSENDVLAMETLTHQIAAAIENARLYEAGQKELAERKQAEKEILQRNRELALLNRIITASVTEPEPEIILEITCRELALIFDLPQVMTILLNEEKTEAVCVAEYRVEGWPSTLYQHFPVKGNYLIEYPLAHKGPLVVEKAQRDPRLASLHNLMRQYGIVSLLILPLIIEGGVIGCIELHSGEPRSFSAEEISLAWSVTDQVASALAKARLAQTRERLIAAIEQTAESVIITDTEGTILYVNPAFERVSGYSRNEVIGQNPRILKSDQQDEAIFKELWTTITAGGVWQGRLVNKRKDGTLYVEDGTVVPVRDSSGTVVNYVSVQRDVTRELQLEEQYRQAQKMEAIGRLSGGVAHDFNNLLVVITGYSELLLQRHLDAHSPLRNYVEEIRKAGERAATLTQQLLAFSRKQVMQPEVLDLNLIVGNMEKMLRRLIGEDIDLVTMLAEELGRVKADPGQIEQVMMNLAVNARDAMPHGGKLTIETANIVVDETYTHRHFGMKSGPYVMLAVSDTGMGMDEKTRSRIFEPFFTTKERGKGTGLGLATVYGIVKQSGGEIWVYSEPGHGSVFKVYLPRVDEVVAGSELRPGPSGLPRGQETLLLVEDEEAVRTLSRQVLEMCGYTVLEARHGEEALLLCEQYQAPIHLLVTDVIMPQMSGYELAQRLLPLRPELKVIYTSGYTDDAIVHHGVLEPGLFFLQKPFTPNSLASKVREVLDAPSLK